MVLSRRRRSEPAYVLVDPSALPDELRDEILEDANAGGETYGLRVVEEMVVGGARAPLYGYYKDVKDPANPEKLLNDSETRWNNAKTELGISSAEVSDDEVAPFGATADPRREAALRQQAQSQALAEATRIQEMEDGEVAEITGDRDPSQSHAGNIVDDTLSPDATNVVSATGDVEEEVDEEETPSRTPRASKNKAPK